MKRSLQTFLLLPALLLGSACQPQPDAGSAPQAAAAPAAAPTAVAAAPKPAPLVVAFAVTGDRINPPTGTLPEDIKEFSSSDLVYAELMLDGTADQARVTVHWKNADGNVVHEDERSVAVAGRTPVIFSHRPDPAWIPGAYSVVFDVNGKPSWELQFQVR